MEINGNLNGIFGSSSKLFLLSDYWLKVVDCSKSDLTEINVPTVDSFEIKDLCCFERYYGVSYLVCAKGKSGLYYYQVENKYPKRDEYILKDIWKVQGQLHMSCHPLDAQRVVHGQRRLFVHDIANRCVQMFDLNGVHISELVREGEMGIRTIRNLLWCNASSSLLVGHGDIERKYDFSRIELVPRHK